MSLGKTLNVVTFKKMIYILCVRFGKNIRLPVSTVPLIFSSQTTLPNILTLKKHINKMNLPKKRGKLSAEVFTKVFSNFPKLFILAVLNDPSVLSGGRIKFRQ
jgi:hypothetical protein